MADINNINPDDRYVPSEATRSSWFPVDRDYLTSLGYPLSGKGKHAQLSFQINPPGSTGPLDVNVTSTGSGLSFLTQECSATIGVSTPLDTLMENYGTDFTGDTSATGITIQLSPSMFGAKTIEVASAGSTGIVLSNEAGFQPNMLSFKINDVSDVYIKAYGTDTVLFKVLIER